MMRRAAWLLLLLALGPQSAPAADPPLLRLQGAYLAYSHDHGFILGHEVRFEWRGWTVTGGDVRIDVPARRAAVLGRVVLTRGQERREGDELLFDLEAESGILVRYGEEMDVSVWPDTRGVEDAAAEARSRRSGLEGVSWARMRGSLLYASARAIEILPSFEVYGDDVLFHVEGLESVGFKRLKLSFGDKAEREGLSLDRVWYTRNQGLFGDLSLDLGRESRLRSRTQLHYEEHSILSDYAGLPRQVDLQTSNVWTAGSGWDFGLDGNYSSTGLGNARLSALVKSRDKKRSAAFDLSYNKPLQSAGETWLGLKTDLDSESWGRLSFSGRQELHDQTLASLAYDKGWGRRIRLNLDARYAHYRVGGRGASASRILTGQVGLTYEADGYRAAAEYSLNDDLIGGRRLTQPQLRLTMKPVTFYGGLLTAGFSNALVFQTLNDDGEIGRSYNDNAVFSLAATPVRPWAGFTLRPTLSAEQFMEKEGRNFTSGGLVLQAVQEIRRGVTLEVFYSAQSRRRTRGWLVEGTTSQDLTAAFRIKTGGRIEGWASVSFDPKHGDWKRGFADLSLVLFKSWRIQSLLSYDFFAGRMANVDLYLVRKAGRFDLRLLWRSLSKQLLIELVPAI